MFSQSFFESLLELNQLDPYRNQEYDKHFDQFIIHFDEICYQDRLKLFKALFLPSNILKLFENTYNLIDTIEANILQKDKIFKLKKDPLKYLTPIINGLEKKLILAQAEGDKNNCKKIELSIQTHKQFLNDPLQLLHSFQQAKIFLYQHKQSVNYLYSLTSGTRKQKEAKEIVEKYIQLARIGEFYKGYEFISSTYQHKLWHSVAIKIYKLCKLLNPTLIDNVLKEKIEYLFLQAEIKLTLNTTRLNKADLFTLLENIPIWSYEADIRKRSLNIDIQNERAILKLEQEKNNINETTNPYFKIFENNPLSIFLLA